MGFGVPPKLIFVKVTPVILVAAFATVLTAGQQSAPSRSPSEAPSGSSKSLDFDYFKSRVEPIFLKRRSVDHGRCYSCHEKSKHSSGFRLETLPAANGSWTEDQSRRNFQVVTPLVVPGAPMSSVFLLRPLAPEAGGDAVRIHSGGRQFESQNDADWQTVAEWIRGAKASGSSLR